jgi:hypothetical protein
VYKYKCFFQVLHIIKILILETQNIFNKLEIKTAYSFILLTFFAVALFQRKNRFFWLRKKNIVFLSTLN